MSSVQELRAVLLERSVGTDDTSSISTETRLDGVRGRVRRTRARRQVLVGATAVLLVAGTVLVSPMGAHLRSSPPASAVPVPSPLRSSGPPPARLPLQAQAELASTDARRVVQLFVQPTDGVVDVELSCRAAGPVGFVLRLGDSRTTGTCDAAGMSARLHVAATPPGSPSAGPVEVQAMFVDPPGSPRTAGDEAIPATGPLPPARLLVGAYLRGAVLATAPTPAPVVRSPGSHVLAEGTLTDAVRSRTVTAVPVGGKPVTLGFTCAGDWAGLEVEISVDSSPLESMSCGGLSPSVALNVTPDDMVVGGRPLTFTIILVESWNRPSGGYPAEPPRPATTAALRALVVPFTLFEGEPG